MEEGYYWIKVKREDRFEIALYRNDGLWFRFGYDVLFEPEEIECIGSRVVQNNAVSHIPYQLCPKCNGDGDLSRYNSPAIASSVKTIVCDVCEGNKIIPMCVIEKQVVSDGQKIEVKIPEGFKNG